MGEADEIPFLDLSGKSSLGGCGGGGGLEEGLIKTSSADDDERWKVLCTQVREACERHGLFFVAYDKIPTSLRADMLEAMKALFDLPEETKNKYVIPKPYRSYVGNCPKVPFQQSLGIDDAHKLETAQAFTTVMWPEGNPSFCETLNTMSMKMVDLNFLMLRMIFESFGVGRQYESHVEDSNCIFRMMKYVVPPSDAESPVGLVAHTDKNALTVLCQNEVQGLEFQTKDGNWVQAIVPQDAFIVIVGDALKAWSNGRVHAVRHRVVVSGDKDRYSCGLFSEPKEEAMIEVPNELVDKEHPLLYRPFNYSHYLSYFVSKLSDDALEIYAGI